MPDERVAALATEARWHTAATLLVLPMLMFGMVTAAVLVFGALEMALATARRRPALVPLPVAPRPSARGVQAS